MDNQEWWAAKREAAEFWRKVMANQGGARAPNGPVRGSGAVQRAHYPEFGAPRQRRVPNLHLCAML